MKRTHSNIENKAENKISTSCCPEGSWGAPLEVSASIKSEEGAQCGKTFMVGSKDVGDELEIYVAGASDGAGEGGGKGLEKKAIIVFTDVWGFSNRLYAICDKLSQDLQLYVVALDCLRGETKEKHSHDMMGWLKHHPYQVNDVDVQKRIHPINKDIENTLQFLTTTYQIPSTDIGCIGFCWGVWAMVKACSMSTSTSTNPTTLHPFKCGVGFHPSLKFEDKAFHGNQISMVKHAVEKVPLLLCVAGNDDSNLKGPRGEVFKVVEGSFRDGDGTSGGGEDGKEKKEMPKCVEFPEMKHGWVSRGDTGEERVKEEAERALKLATDFFRDWM